MTYPYQGNVLGKGEHNRIPGIGFERGEEKIWHSRYRRCYCISFLAPNIVNLGFMGHCSQSCSPIWQGFAENWVPRHIA